jgi:hypothetical protein
LRPARKTVSPGYGLFHDGFATAWPKKSAKRFLNNSMTSHV